MSTTGENATQRYSVRRKDRERKWREIKKERRSRNINIILLLALVLVLTKLRALTGKVSGVPHFALKARFYLSFFFRRLQTKILEGAKYIN